jgi:hypothetical protein
VAQQTVDRGQQGLEGARPRRQTPIQPDRHQIGAPAELIGCTERRKTAYRGQHSTRIDQVLIGDQGAVLADEVRDWPCRGQSLPRKVEDR